MNDTRPAQIRMTKWTPAAAAPLVDEFLARPAVLAEAEETARAVIAAVRARGDAAVSDYCLEFDGAKLSPARFAVSKAERMASIDKVDADFKEAVREVLRRISRFGQAGLRKDWSMQSPKGGTLGEQFQPLDRVGCYVPGGAAPLASTALMTAALARVAGVPEIVACTPGDKSGKVNPHIVYALDAAGATEIYRVGGIQAIAAMALGTKSIRAVQKIVGPGGPYVTAAKKLVYGEVDIDMVAGPSEVAILADDSANPVFVAADMLAQAEHGTGHEKALLVTSSAQHAYAVNDELLKQSKALARSKAVQEVLANGTLIAIVDNLDVGMDLVNRFAPEHLQIMVREPRIWLKKVRRAGAVFLGPWTPECAGDFVAGPSHVLPTGGTAAMFSGLTVDSFRRRTSFISFTRADLHDTLQVIDVFSRVEKLDGHGKSARVRFEK